MCGIVGLVRWEGLQAGDPERIARAAKVLAHRGPDGGGAWHDEHCALGFRRLKVMDPSKNGDQPMASEDGSLQVVFNGELYNFRALREQLQAQGHVFRSQSDTEVLLHGCEAWGPEGLLEKLRGMFAFGLWDAKARRLFLARDPLGVKPLYFAERKGCLLFASEPKALFASGLVEPQLDPAALHEALTYRYVPAPRSGYRDVEKLPPGHCAVAEHGTLHYHAWWKPSSPGREEGREAASGGGASIERLAERLRRAVEARLQADVPLGAWLSGGLDSGLVLSMMGEGRSTFAAGFAQPEWDERELARASAEHFKTRHAEFEIPADVFKLLPQIVWHADEPFFDSSCLPTFVLAERTRTHLRVVLSGDGGDEAFAGYERYVGMKVFERWTRTPAWLRGLLRAFASWRHPLPSRQGWDRMVRWLEKCRAAEGAGFPAYLGAMTLFSQEQIRALYGESLAEANAELDGREYLSNALKRAAQERYPDDAPSLHLLEAGVLQRADLATYLPGDVLHKVDRMAMAHGVEVRSPFLDVELLHFALSLPDELRLPGRTTKPLLRSLAAGRLPPDVTRARKRGFGVPLDEWFRGPLAEPAMALFEESHLAADGLFKPRFWTPLWKEHQARRANHGERLYALLAAELWYRTFLSGAPALQRPAPLA